MKVPELKQFGELDAEDFERHPVWIGCHTADYGRPWYEDTDEETFRPYTGKLPADPSEGILLVRAVIELHDGSRHPGFVSAGSDLGTQQPQIFAADRQFGFWGGMVGISEQAQQELYAALDKGRMRFFRCVSRLIPDSRPGKPRVGLQVSIKNPKEVFTFRSHAVLESSGTGNLQQRSGFEYQPGASVVTHNQKEISNI